MLVPKSIRNFTLDSFIYSSNSFDLVQRRVAKAQHTSLKYSGDDRTSRDTEKNGGLASLPIGVHKDIGQKQN